MSQGSLDVVIVGGGPAGLYLSILLAQQAQGHRIRVLDRNQPGDAYGFGVVFSDETLDNFQIADAASYTELASGFRRWGEIRVHHPDGEEFDLRRPWILGDLASASARNPDREGP